ncbi:MAG: bacillithiol biosynthesis cysteine-adding enzyme BshC, partial [Bacteroidota bacterium]
LAQPNTFTVTTGHQLNLFTGPLYFLYKIFSVINLAEQLQKRYPKAQFVPVYWMATEDHDFDEINYFNFQGRKFGWDRSSGGAVGELTTEGLEDVLQVFTKAMGPGDRATHLAKLFERAYVRHQNLADATRYLGNELFKAYGLVIVDGNDPGLKTSFVPFAKKEITEHLSHSHVTKTTEALEQVGYKKQVHPREINLFYLKAGLRERIVEKDEQFHVNDTQISFSREDLLQEMEIHPERFSPNALLRPLYQEVILPNLCYTGGGGELAYWFQLKDYFEAVEVPFPVLLLRNSVLLVDKKYGEKLEKLEMPLPKLFLKQLQLTNEYTHQLSDIDIDFSAQRKHLQQQFEALHDLATRTDRSFEGAVAAQEKKQLNGLDHLEKRLLKAQKRKLADRIQRLLMIQDALFPGQSLQERQSNFSEFYLEYGDRLFSA